MDAFASVAGGRDAIEGQFKAATGLDLQQDVLSWMGDFGIFVRGKPGEPRRRARGADLRRGESVRFLAALARLAKTQADSPATGSAAQRAGGGKGFTLVSPDIPKPIHAFVRDGKLVFAYGDAAAKDAVNPADKLGDSPDFTSVKDSLGDYDVSMYVLVKPILDLVDSTRRAATPTGRRRSRTSSR